MIEFRGGIDKHDFLMGERAARLIGDINPRLLSLHPYVQALQIGCSVGERDEAIREVSFDLDQTRYQIVTEFRNGSNFPPSRLIIAKYNLTPRGPAYQKEPLATLQLIAERAATDMNIFKHGYVGLIVGRLATPIERNDQMPLVNKYFAEFLS